MDAGIPRGVAVAAVGLALLASLAVSGWNAGFVGTAGAALAFAVFVNSIAGSDRVALNRLDVVVGAFAAWTLATTLLRELPWAATYQATVFALIPLGYLVARADAAGAWSSLRALILTLAAAVAGTSLVVVAFGAEPNVWFPIRNTQAAFLNVALFLSLARAPLDVLRAPAWRYGVAVTLAAGIAVTGSRGASVALFAASAASVLVVPRVAWIDLMRFGGAVVAGLGAGTLLTAGWFAERVSSVGGGASSRWDMWFSALPLVWDKPLFGHGLGMTESVWAPLRVAHTLDRSSGLHLHGDYLQFAVEAGIPSVALLGLVLLVALRVATTTADATLKSAAALGASITLAVHCLVDYHLQLPLTALVFGLVLGSLSALDPLRLLRAPRRVVRWAAGITAAVLAVQAVLFAAYDAAMPGVDSRANRLAGGYAAEFVHHRALPDTHEAVDLLEALQSAIRLQPRADDAQVAAAALLRALGRPDDAAAALDRALDSNPRSYHAHYQRALLALDRGEVPVAIRELEASVRLRPRFLAAHELLVAQYLGVGRDDDAYRQLRAALFNIGGYDMPQRPFIQLGAEFAAAHRDLDLAARVAWLRGRRELGSVQ